MASNTEIYFLLFEALAFYLVFIEGHKNFLLIRIGFFVLGIAFIIKYIIIFDIFLFWLAYNVLLLIEYKDFGLKKILHRFIYSNVQIVLFLILPFLFSCVLYLAHNSFNSYFEAILFVLRGHSKVTTFSSKIEFLLQLKYILGLLVFLIFLNHKEFLKSRVNIVSSIWILTSSLGAIWTGFLYEHYLLAIFYPMFFLLGSLLSTIKFETHKKKLKSIFFVVLLVIFSFNVFKTRSHLKKTLMGIPDQGRIVADAIAKRISSNKRTHNSLFFISNGTHSPYVLLDQLPPVKWVQPNNYSEKIFFENLNLDLGELFASLESKPISVVSWCYKYSIEELDSGTVKDESINGIYVKKLNLYLKNGNFKGEKLNKECQIYYL
ncbi:hypothetical protein [Leptospira levettii]|uniref:hypothetical protein n=1 Tax=Leptospira levettii TaxID=2023178 RepID=UPI000F6439CE|nr:hypothetical protein [Leptospira levettii]